MTTPVRITINRAGVRALLKSKQVEDMLMERGRRVHTRVQSVVPVDSGNLRAKTTVERSPTPNRARVQVVLNTPYAAKIAADTPAIAAALDAAGD